MAEEVELPAIPRQPEMANEVVELGAEELFGPECGVAVLRGKMCGAAASDLVVEQDGDAVVFPEVGQAEKVVVRNARAAVQGDEGGPCKTERSDERVEGVSWFVGSGDGKRDSPRGSGDGVIGHNVRADRLLPPVILGAGHRRRNRVKSDLERSQNNFQQ